MSIASSKGVDKKDSDVKTNTSNGVAMADLNDEDSTPKTRVRSEEVAREKRALTDRQTKQLKFCVSS